MSVYALIDTDVITDDILEMDIWQESRKVGRWRLILKNIDNKWAGDLLQNDDSFLKINNVTMMAGYLDDPYPFLDEKMGVYTNKIKVLGRDYGRDLAKLYHSAGYVDTKADDLLAALLAAVSSEIIYSSPSTAPIVNMERSRTYLIDWFNDVTQRVNYDTYVTIAKVLHFFAYGTESSGVTLKSQEGQSDNNILSLLKGEALGFSIVNEIELTAGPVQGHWTDGNHTDFTPGANTTVTYDPTEKMAGTSSIRFFTSVNSYPQITLDFSGAGLYSHAGLDLSRPTEMSYYIRHTGVTSFFSVRPILEDVSGNIIEFKRGPKLLGVQQKGQTEVQVHSKWLKLQVPIGDSEDNIIASSEKNNRWYFLTGSSFDWSNVKKITWKCITATQGAASIWLDLFCIPSVEVLSAVKNQTSIDEHGRSMWHDERRDIRSQIELDVIALKELNERKDEIKNLRIIADGQTGSKYAGLTLEVIAPKHGITSLTAYRVIKLHHQVRKNPIMKGRTFITTYDLIRNELNPVTQLYNSIRFTLAEDPIGAMLELAALNRRRIKSVESTQKPEFGDTHPVIKVFYSGSGTVLPTDPEDGFIFQLTADIASTHLAGYYQYDESSTSWIRQPAIFRRATNPTYGQLEGDINRNTGDGKIYQWTGSTWEFIGTADHGLMGGLGDDDHTQYLDTTRHTAIEHLASMMAIETRPWTSNFNVSYDKVTPDFNKLYYGKGGAESTTDADISIAGVADLINQQTEDLVPDGLWYLYWDENFKTGDDYDVKRTADILVATGVGKGLLAAVIVDEAGSNPPAVNPMGGYTPTVSAGMMAARFIVAGMLDANFVIGDVEIKTGAGVQWPVGGNPGVIMTDLGIRGKGAGGALMVEILASTGKILAAGGTVVLDSLGMTISDGGQIYFYDNTKALNVAQLVPYYQEPTIFGTMLQALNSGEITIASAAASVTVSHAGYITLYAPDGYILTNGLRPLGLGDKNIGDINTPFDEIHGLNFYGYPNLPVLTSKPSPSSNYKGRVIRVRSGSGTKTYIYICVQNDANAWEWIQIGVST